MGDVEDVLERMRMSLKRRGAEGIRGLARHFKICGARGRRPTVSRVRNQRLSSSLARQRADTNKNGTLDADEFEKCCRLNNLGLSKADMVRLKLGPVGVQHVALTAASACAGKADDPL